MFKKILMASLIMFAFSQATPVAAYTDSIFGPQSWSNGTTSGRYRSHIGYHTTFLTVCTGNQTVELRVDIINNPDVSEGYSTMTCGGANGNIYSSVDSYTSLYRGHFMQSHSNFYGTFRDRHQ